MVTHRVNKEPVLIDGLLVEEERSSRKSLVQEVTSESGNPMEDGETGASLQHDESNDLLKEKSNNDGRPNRWKKLRI
jgi:hypothetical protein